MQGITFKRSDYTAALADWLKIDAVVNGTVKNYGEAYLPNPNAVEDGQEARKIYERYKERAAFFNATGSTLRSLVGMAFKRWPSFERPPEMDYLEDDADGSGVSIYQQSQNAVAEVLAKGRKALFVDYPQVDRTLSRAEMASGYYRPTIISLDAEQVINWRTERVGSSHKLVQVVFWEEIEAVASDGIGVEFQKLYRRLMLVDGVYMQQVWVQGKESTEMVSEFTPRDGAGRTWDVLPFCFIGSQNNDHRIDNPPMLDMVNLNIKHYQVSADWYNALFYAGQPQPWMAGLTTEWRDWLEEHGYIVGSRSVIPLPEGGQFAFATVPAETAIQSELKDIEQRMVAIGARLIQSGVAVKTAQQARDESEATTSVLSLAVENVNEAYNKALGYVARYLNIGGEWSYQVNSQFIGSADAQMVTALVALYNTGRFPDDDLFRFLRRSDLIDPTKTDDEIREALEGQSLGTPGLNFG